MKLDHIFKPGDPAHGWENQCSHPAPDGLRHCGYGPEAHSAQGTDGPCVPVPTLEQALAYFDSLRPDDQAYMRRMWNGEECLSGWSAMRLHSVGLVVRDGGAMRLTEKGRILGEALLRDGDRP